MDKSNAPQQPIAVKRGLIAAIAISLAATIIVIYLTYKPGTLKSLLSANILLVFAAFLITLLSYFFNSLALKILSLEIEDKLSFGYFFRVFVAGTFASLVTPFGSGGLPVQVYLIKKGGYDTSESLAIVTGRAIISIWFFGFLSPVIAYLFFGGGFSNAFLAPVIAIISLTILLFAFIIKPKAFMAVLQKLMLNRLSFHFFGKERLEKNIEGIKKSLERYHNSLSLLLSKKSYLLLAALSESFAWILFIFVGVIIVISLGWYKNLPAIFFRILVLQALIPFSPTPGGSGVAEGGLAAGITGLAPAHLAGPAVFLWRFVTFYLFLVIGGLVFASFFSRSKDSRASRARP